MAKTSSKPSATRKVAKVARTGGGRTKRGQTSWVFPTLITTVCVVGLVLIFVSRQDRQPDTSRPRLGDHWHSAIGFDICGTFAPNLTDQGEDILGIHTHGEGIVHTHPFSSQATGARATLSQFFEMVGANVTSDAITLPGQQKKNGDTCDNGPGVVQVKVWDTRAPDDSGRVVTGDPGDIRLGNNQLITVSFLPSGAEIPKPPSEPELDRLSDVGPATSTTIAGPTTLPGETTTSVAPTTTSAPTTTTP